MPVSHVHIENEQDAISPIRILDEHVERANGMQRGRGRPRRRGRILQRGKKE